VILVDTSGWIEFLRDTGSSACEAVDRLIADDPAICDPVAMAVLAGARDERHLAELRGLLGRATMLPTTSADYDAAAALYRACRVGGETVRKLIDCLIGAVAIKAGAEVLHADADFAVLARHTDLRAHEASTL
jgi:predicted nucleic acid-binding protein